jgi:flagellin-like protein
MLKGVKRGISDVVATVLIIMITIAAVGIVWAIIIPMIRDSVDSRCDNIDVSIQTGGYTCYDSGKKILMLQVVKGSSDINVTGLNVYLESEGSSFAFPTNLSFTRNEYKSFCVNASNVGEVDGVGVVPIVSSGMDSKECGKISISNIPSCVLTADSCNGMIGIYAEEEIPVEEEYPQFSSYADNSNTLIGSGLAIFNVSVLNTNGTVLLEINGENRTANLVSGNIYNVSFTITSGTYSYKWYAFGSGISNLINVSIVRNYVVDSQGSGTLNDPFKIYNWAGLDSIRNNLTASYVLINNLNATSQDYNGIGNNWKPIGNLSVQFKGSLNGKGYVISELNVTQSNKNYIGLFGSIYLANISNVFVRGNVSGKGYVGMLTGHSVNSFIINSSSVGIVVGSMDYTGGLAGYVNETIISNSYSIVNLTGGSYVGGLAGFIYSTGVGLSNSYSGGNVKGNARVGGLVGYIYSTVTFSNSYSIVNLTGGSYVGGLAGSVVGSGSNSYWYNRSQGLSCYSTGTGNVGCIAITDINYFKNYDNAPMNMTAGNGWDFNNIWSREGNGTDYPKLKWQN